jgi:sensor domain CHASE-containing protein
VRHRSPNPAVVSASPISHSSNTGAINGTRMNRKP